MTEAVPKVQVDFQNADLAGRVRLNTAGSAADIERQSIELRPGLRLLLVDGELSASGELAWSEEERVWVAAIDWDEVIQPNDT